MTIENELQHALRRKPAPDGLAGRVMLRIEREGHAPRRWWRAAAAAVVLTAVLGGWTAHTVIEQRRAGEKARKEVLLALQITGAKIRYAQSHVHEIGTRQ